jgi:N4-gp56 family major capsid protein
MASTQLPAGDARAQKIFAAAMFAQTQRANTFTNKMTGPAPQQAAAEAKLKSQTSSDMPIVRVTDLSRKAGDTVQVDMYHTTGGLPIVGDRNAEGKGVALSSSQQEIRIDLLTHVVDAGGKMAQQRTTHGLRGLALASLSNYFPRLEDQMTMVHLAGARGSQVDTDWIVPLQTDPEFASIMINPVLAPTYNRHFVASGLGLEQGGLALDSIATTDVLALEHIEHLDTLLHESEFKLQPVKLPDDPAADDDPLYVLLVSYKAWMDVRAKMTGKSWTTFIQNAWQRASYGSKHPLFKGSAGMWGNILVKRMERCVRFNASNAHQYVTAANRLTATETAGTIAAGIGTTHTVDRCLLLGGQALAKVYGAGKMGSVSNWKERPYNFDRAMEVMGDLMGGSSKLRFEYKNNVGLLEKTDHGVIVLDVAATNNAVAAS